MFRTALIAVALFLLMAGTALAAPPTGGTQLGDARATDATVRAYLGSDDGSVTYFFEYGTTAMYGSRTADVTVATTPNGQSFTQVISGLSPSTAYHYRVRARNSSPDELIGNDFSFTTQVAPVDTDGDGFADNQDSCPTTPGAAQGPDNASGCPVAPDTDGDGWRDPQDTCPTVAGPPPSSPPQGPQGCPLPPNPDRDGDSVTNEYDQCPDVAGSQDAVGCPDADGDWVRDSEDACPNQKGSNEEGGGSGCPDKDGDGVPKVTGFFNFPTTNTWEMAKDTRDIVVCRDTPLLVHCTWRIKVSLTAASARKLRIKDPVLVDTTVKTTKRSKLHDQVFGLYPWNPTKELHAALKKGGAVTIVKTGSYRVEGTDEWQRIDKEKVKVKPKSCGFNRFACDD